MASLFGKTKLKKNGGGEETGEEALKGKVMADTIVGLYFSAHWCPPCRNFTPLLKDFYSELEDSGEFEIVFISSDRSEEELKKYLEEAHGPWYYLPLAESQLKMQLSKKFGIRGIPSLVIAKSNGEVITKEGRTDVTSKPPPQALAAWKSA